MNTKNLELVHDFLEYIKNQRNYSEHTIKNYSIDLQQFAKYVKKSFVSISKDDLAGFIKSLRERGLDITTINRKLACLKSFYTFLSKSGYTTSILSDIEFLKDEKNTLPKITDFKKLRKAIDQINDIRDKLIFKMLLYTGIRVSELVNIKLSDINFAYKTITIRGKGNKFRAVVLHPELESLIQEYITTYKPTKYLLENKQTGRPITARTVEYTTKKYFPELHPHIFRHTFATHFLLQKGNIKAVKELLGHSSLQTTDKYLKLCMDTIKTEYFSVLGS